MTPGDIDKPDMPAFMKPGPAKMDYPGETEPTFDDELLPIDTNTLPVPAGVSRAFESRWMLIAQLHARGHTNVQIAKQLNYTPQSISNVLLKDFTRVEIAKERERLRDTDAVEIMKRTSVHAAKRLERIILDPDSKNGDAMSQFILEKNTGKATQEIKHDHGTLSSFHDMLRAMQQRGEVIDVTPTQITDSDSLQPPIEDTASQWLDKNLT